MDDNNIEVSYEILGKNPYSNSSKDSIGRADQKALIRLYNDLDDVEKQELLRYAVFLRRKSAEVLK